MLKDNKENQYLFPKNTSVLNSPSPTIHKSSPKLHKQDTLILAVEEGIANGQCDLINLLLTDPLLKELNLSLEKEAEQQKKNKLLQNFPLRYKNLVHTQMLYKKVQGQLKQHQRHSHEVIEQLQREKQTLEDQLSFLKLQLAKKEDMIVQMKQSHSLEIASLREDSRLQLEKSERNKQKQFEEKEKIMTKVRSQKEHIVQFLEEIKEESQTLKQQNQRLVQLLTQKDLDLNHLHSAVAEFQNQYENSKKSFMAQIVQLELQSTQKVQQITRAHQELSLVAEALKTRLRQSEDQIVEILRQKEDEETQQFNQMQQMRGKLLEVVREKNNLQEQIQMLRGDNQRRVGQLENELVEVKRESSDQNQKMGVMKIQYQYRQSELRQKLIRLEASKDIAIKQLQSKILQQNNNNKNLLQQIESITQSREQLIALNITLKNQIKQSKTTLNDSTSAQKKIQAKNTEIQLMVAQLKQQILNFNQIIQQKDQKIQEYRQEIFALRSRVSELAGHHDQRDIQIATLQQNLSLHHNKIDQLKQQIQKAQYKQKLLTCQIDQYKHLINSPKEDKQCQTVIQQQSQQQQIAKMLEKTNLKYENALEELKTYKTQYDYRFSQQEQVIEELGRASRQKENMIVQLERKLIEKQQTISEYEKEVADLKRSINQNMYDGNEIQQVFDIKINELKTFYEQKIQAQSSKYKGVILLLKQEMSQLYREIDLKKTIEEQIFKEIVKLDTQTHEPQPL